MTTAVKEALDRQRTVPAWNRRLDELIEEHRRAERNMKLALEIAADAVAELQEASREPVRVAPSYYRTSRPLPFNPELMLESFVSALRRRGVRVDGR